MTDMDPFVAAVAARLLERRVERVVAEIESAVAIPAHVRKVVKVKTEHGSAGKARLEFVAANSTDGEVETIETDWLSDPIALHVATVAKNAAANSTPVVLRKLNAPDPTGKVPQGFRRVVWADQ